MRGIRGRSAGTLRYAHNLADRECPPCYSWGMSEMKDSFLVRAAAHSRAPVNLPHSARFRNVTDEQVAGVFYLMEAEGQTFTYTRYDRWVADTSPVSRVLRKMDVDVVIREMIRTGLLRAWIDRDGQHLIPARVHFRDLNQSHLTACRDSVEGMRSGRVRTVSDLTLVDCLECEAAVVRGGPRGL